MLIAWLEAHDKLAGWAQFLGAVMALGVTYFTAFAPNWKRRDQLKKAALRLLSNGYETMESYHRTSAQFPPFALSVRAASMSFQAVMEEMSRFPIYELEDQGSNSPARRLIAMGTNLAAVRLILDNFARQLETDTAGDSDWDEIRIFLDDRLKFAEALFLGKELKRPEGVPFTTTA